MKTMMVRFINGFCFATAFSTVVQMIQILVTNKDSMLPEYMERFSNPVMAFCVQLLLIGFMSGVASAGGVIMELKRPGLLAQSILFLVLLLATWIPVACFLWGFHKYTRSMVISIVSILFTYAFCWILEYKTCARDIREINKRLGAE